MDWINIPGKITVRCPVCDEEIAPDKQSKVEHQQYHKRKSVFCRARGIRFWSTKYPEVPESQGAPLCGDPSLPPDVFAQKAVFTLEARYLPRVDAKLHDLDFPIARIETFAAFVADQIAEWPALQQIQTMLLELLSTHWLTGKLRKRGKQSGKWMVHPEARDASGRWQPAGAPYELQLSKAMVRRSEREAGIAGMGW